MDEKDMKQPISSQPTEPPLVRYKLHLATKMVLLILAGLSLVMVHRMVSNIGELRTLKQKAVVTRENVKKMQHSNESLQAEVEKLKDENHIADIARAKYHYSQSGEIIFQLPGTSDDEDQDFEN